MKFSETLPLIEPANFNEWQSLVQKSIKTEDTSILNDIYLNEKLTTDFIYFKDKNLQNYFSNISQVIFDSYTGNSELRNNYSLNRNNNLFSTIFCNQYSEKGLNQVSEVTLAIQELITNIENGEKKNFLFKVVLREDFYLNIAKLRALRYLICKVLESFASQSKFLIIAESCSYNKSYSQEHNNLIRITTEALSGNLGVADITEPSNYDRTNLSEDSLSNTISQNVNIILEFESIIKSSIDATNGSYFIDKLSFDFVNKVMSNIETKLDVEEVINRNKASDESNLFNFKKTMIGVNKYSFVNSNISSITFNINDLTNTLEQIQSINFKDNNSIYCAFLCNPNSVIDKVKFTEKLFKSLGFKIVVGTFLESIEDLQNVIDFNNFENIIVFTDNNNNSKEVRTFIQTLPNRKITILFPTKEFENLPENVIIFNQLFLLETMNNLLIELNRVKQYEI